MADPTPANGQITDAVTETGVRGADACVKPAGEALPSALSTLAQLTAQATSLNLSNAVTAEQAETILARAAASSLGVVADEAPSSLVTDSVTKAPGEPPGSLGALYQSLAAAVAGQGGPQIYTFDTTIAAGAAGKSPDDAEKS